MKNFSERYNELNPEAKRYIDVMIADKALIKDFCAYLEDVIRISAYRDKVDAALFIWEYML